MPGRRLRSVADGLEIAAAGPIATLAIRRPETRNALTPGIIAALTGALREAGGRSDVRVVVIRGAGDLPFSAGFDLGELPDRILTAEDALAIHAPVRELCDAVCACPHPVIGAARKFVFGAALDLFCHCDLRVAEEGTTFAMPPNRFGFLYPREGIFRLADVVGLSRATEMLFVGTAVPADDARAFGLVHRLSAADAFENELAGLCATVAANAPLSLRGTKRALADYRGARRKDTPASRLAAYAEIAACLNSADVREARAAFREKRPPRFEGR